MDIVTIIVAVFLGGVVLATLWGRLRQSVESALSFLRRRLLGLPKTGPASGSEPFSDDK